MTTKSPSCSVICITYNHARFAGAALQSIYDQSCRDIEIVVIDDGSTDGTAEIVRQSLDASPFPAQLIAQDNTGNIPLNLNRALARATGTFVTFLSLDDMFNPDAIQARMAAIKVSETYAFVVDTHLDRIDETGATTEARCPSPFFGTPISTGEEMLECEYQTHGAFFLQSGLFRHSIVDAAGAFDEDMIGDDIILRTKIFRYLVDNPELGFAFVDQSGFRHRQHGDNLHLRYIRQIETVVQWRNRFFPDRPLPDALTGLIRYCLDVAMIDWDEDELTKLRGMAPEIAAMADAIPMTDEMRKARFRSRLRRVLGRRG